MSPNTDQALKALTKRVDVLEAYNEALFRTLTTFADDLYHHSPEASAQEMIGQKLRDTLQDLENVTCRR